MLNQINDYKYLTKDSLYANDGKDPRITFNDKVLGTRKQVRIPKPLDYFYLNELAAIHSVELPNSVEMQWPIEFWRKFPTPHLANFVDIAKLDQIQAEVDDMYVFSGGEDPDYEKLRKNMMTQLTNNILICHLKKNAIMTKLMS